MKKMLKKFAALSLAGIMTAVALAGCGGPDSGETTNTPVSDASTDGSEEESSSQTGGDPVVIRAVMKDMSADDDVSVKFLEQVSAGVSEELGREVSIELVPISDGSYAESVGLLLQSGEIPDLIYFQGGDYQFAVTQEILEDLTPYVESSVHVKAAMQPFNEQRLENYPYLLWLAPDRVKVPVVRKDWLEAAETGAALLEDPTVENYKAFFTELKEQNQLAAAFTVPGDLTELDTVFDLAFGITGTWMEKDGTYVYSKVTEETKNKLAFYAELYQEGLLDSEYLSKKWDTKESAFYNGEVGVVSGTQGGVVDVYSNKITAQNGEEAELVVLPPAKGVSQGYTPSAVNKESRGWAVSAYSENKDVAFAILEYMASPEGQILDKLGFEGEHYNLEGDTYVLTEKASEWYARFHESTKTFDAKISEETPYQTVPGVESLKMVEEYTTFDNSFVLPDEYVTNWDATEAHCLQYFANVVSGKESLDTFDDFVAEWQELGGQEVTDYANEILGQ